MRISTALFVVAAPLPMMIAMQMGAAQAHEFIIKPAQLQVESGAKLPFSIMATHFFSSAKKSNRSIPLRPG